jgi:hypothetical protein
MSKAKYQRKLETAIVENGLLLIQSKLALGEVKTVTRPFIGKFLEPATKRDGVGHDVTSIIKDAIAGHQGMKFIQSKTGHKEVTVDITGL